MRRGPSYGHDIPWAWPRHLVVCVPSNVAGPRAVESQLETASFPDGSAIVRSRSQPGKCGTNVAVRRSMLRITRLPGAAGSPCLRVEGRLVGDWVQLLENELSRASEAEAMALDLSGVEFADQRALALLQRMSERGVELVACSPLLRNLLGRSEP